MMSRLQRFCRLMTIIFWLQSSATFCPGLLIVASDTRGLGVSETLEPDRCLHGLYPCQKHRKESTYGYIAGTKKSQKGLGEMRMKEQLSFNIGWREEREEQKVVPCPSSYRGREVAVGVDVGGKQKAIQHRCTPHSRLQ